MPLSEPPQLQAARLLREAGLADPDVQRDRWQEARLGAELHFHAANSDRPDGYWKKVYGRWAQLYQRDRDLGLT